MVSAYYDQVERVIRMDEPRQFGWPKFQRLAVHAVGREPV